MYFELHCQPNLMGSQYEKTSEIEPEFSSYLLDLKDGFKMYENPFAKRDALL